MQKSSEANAIRLLSQTAEHALRAVLYLACRPGESIAATEIAQAIGAPANYLSKTLQQMSRSGLVTGTRGPSGGFRLVREPESITIAEVVSMFAEAPRSHMCLLGGRPCSGEHPCAAHEQWIAMHREIAAILEDKTVAALLGDDARIYETTTNTEGWS